MRALWTKLRDRAGDDRDARFPARMGAAIENIGVMRGAIDVPEGESDMRVIVRVGEERDRQDIGLQFRLPEIADIAADTRQHAIIYPFCLQPLAVAQDKIGRESCRERGCQYV